MQYHYIFIKLLNIRTFKRGLIFFEEDKKSNGIFKNTMFYKLYFYPQLISGLLNMYQIVWKISATPSVSLELCYYKDYFCLLVVRGCGGLDSYYKTAHSTELCSLFFLAHNGYRKNIQNYPWAISQLSG